MSIKIGNGMLVPFTEAGTTVRGRAGLSWCAGNSVKVAEFSLGSAVPRGTQPGGTLSVIWSGQEVIEGDRLESHQGIGVVEVIRLKEVVQTVHAAWEVSRATSWDTPF